MNAFVRILHEEYAENTFKLIRIKLRSINNMTIYLTDKTLFRYDRQTNEIILGDCYINNEVISIRFKANYIISLGVLERL